MRARLSLLVALVALATALPSLRNGFVYDDTPVVRDDVRIRSLDPGALLTMPYWSDSFHDRIYRPVTTLSFALDHAVADGRPLPFHAVNICLHVLVSVLLLLFALRWLAPPGATLAALWFAVHPVHVEAFANVVGRSELLAAAGYLGALLAFVSLLSTDDARPVRRGALGVTVLLCALIAYGAKEHALTLPAALMLVAGFDAMSDRSRRRTVAGRAAVPLAVALLAAVGYLLARGVVLGTVFGGGAVAAGLTGLDATGRAMVMLPAMTTWARLLVLPVHLAADYSPGAIEPQLSFGLPHLAGLAVVIAAAGAAWTARRRTPALTLGLLLFAVTASIASNLPFATGVLVAERVLYLPSAGAALALGAAFHLLPERTWRWPAVALLLSLLAARSLERIPVWQDLAHFHRALDRDSPASYRVQWMLGTSAFEAGNPAEGERRMLDAIRTWPADPALVAELGMWYQQGGRHAAAVRFFEAALRGDSMMADVAARLIASRVLAGEPDSAVAATRRLLPRFRARDGVLLAGFTAMMRAGHPAPARALARSLAFLEPERWEPWQLAADAALRLGACDEADGYLRRARTLAPDEPGPRMLAMQRDTMRACRGSGR